MESRHGKEEEINMSMNTVLGFSQHPREFSEAHATNYQIYINQFPNLQFYVTDSFVTSVNLGNFDVPSNSLDIQMSDNKINFDPVTLSFIVDEYFRSYIDIYQWMMNMANPADSLREPDAVVNPQDIHMKILDNNKQPIITFKYISARPIGLDQIVFDTQDENNTVLTSAATFVFDYMLMEQHFGEIPSTL